MAVKSDQKKADLLAEVKVAFEKEKAKVSNRITVIDNEQKGIDKYKHELKSESLKLKEQVNELEYFNKELTSKNKQL